MYCALSGLRAGGAKTIVYFPSMKNDVVLIDLITLGGVWGYVPPGKFVYVSISETLSGGF